MLKYKQISKIKPAKIQSACAAFSTNFDSRVNMANRRDDGGTRSPRQPNHSKDTGSNGCDNVLVVAISGLGEVVDDCNAMAIISKSTASFKSSTKSPFDTTFINNKTMYCVYMKMFLTIIFLMTGTDII